MVAGARVQSVWIDQHKTMDLSSKGQPLHILYKHSFVQEFKN